MNISEQNILVTIAIPVYNAEAFLAESIISILNQSYQNFELIITNDASTDASLSIAQKFKDSRITVIHHEKNKGLPHRLNEQIAMAKGKYFARMDQDDIMFPERIAKQVKFLESHPEIDAIGSAAVIIDNENQIIGERVLPQRNTFKEALKQSFFMHPTVMAKTEWFQKNPYSEDLAGVEDFDLWLKSFKKSKFFNLEEPLLFYRDPLVLKVKTYNFRQKQIRKMYLRFSKTEREDQLESYKQYMLSWIKQLSLNLAAKFNLSHYLMKSRNHVAQKEEYVNILQKALDKKPHL